jgi:hypothetical protein
MSEMTLSYQCKFCHMECDELYLGAICADCWKMWAEEHSLIDQSLKGAGRSQHPRQRPSFSPLMREGAATWADVSGPSPGFCNPSHPQIRTWR